MAVTVILPPASCARGPKRARNCSSSVMSALSCWVTWGIVFQASRRCSAVLRRTPRIDTRSIFPHLAKSGSTGSANLALPATPATTAVTKPLAWALTSSSLIRPPGPVPLTSWMSTPNSRASRRTCGAAGTGSRCSTPAVLSKFAGMAKLDADGCGCSGRSTCSSVLPSAWIAA